ncbi:MAG TPA: HD domain-containing phosphohydrolase, partial [Allocoleopsis sp.]
QLIDQTDLNNPMAAAEVASLAEAMGQLVDLPAWQLHRLRLAGLLHRIAFLTAADSKLTSEAPTRYPDDASRVPLTCPLIPGIQVLRRMQRLRAVATILTHQTEWWNGAGQPSALTGDEIPVESRILGLVSAFQQRLAQLRSTYMQKENALSYEEALAQTLADCKAEEGIRWDPKLVEVLGLLVSAMQQGLSLPVAAPKIAAGLWLLDSHSDEVLLTYEQEEVIR